MDFLSQYDILGAFGQTALLTLYSAIGALVWGVVLAGMRVSPVPIMRGFAAGYVNILRNTPLTLIILFTSVGLASTLGVQLVNPTSPTSLADNNYRLAVIGFVVYTATFVCEAVRSGINTVPVGQAEAARAIGLSFFQTLRMIVLPQALRSVIAPLANVLIALTKNTTVATVIGVGQAALLMKYMIENESDVSLLVFAIFGLGFVALTLPVGLILGWVAKKATVKR
ncbi:MAG: amino acid ABC transporter permease [Sciscionella sp.]